MSAVKIEAHQAARFLDLLGDDGADTFQTLDDGGNSSRLARVHHGQFEDVRPELEALNEIGAGVFVMVNAGDGIVRPPAKTCRTAANVTAVRAVFVDLDGAPIVPVLNGGVAPDWVVQSSLGRWHAYWRVRDCPLEQFTPLQASLAAKYRGDPAVKDLARVMRLPGFVHRKRDPFISQLYLQEDFDKIRKDAA